MPLDFSYPHMGSGDGILHQDSLVQARVLAAQCLHQAANDARLTVDAGLAVHQASSRAVGGRRRLLWDGTDRAGPH